jgi:hypothetical protein
MWTTVGYTINGFRGKCRSRICPKALYHLVLYMDMKPQIEDDAWLIVNRCFEDVVQSTFASNLWYNNQLCGSKNSPLFFKFIFHLYPLHSPHEFLSFLLVPLVRFYICRGVSDMNKIDKNLEALWEFTYSMVNTEDRIKIVNKDPDNLLVSWIPSKS